MFSNIHLAQSQAQRQFFFSQKFQQNSQLLQPKTLFPIALYVFAESHLPSKLISWIEVARSQNSHRKCRDLIFSQSNELW